MYKILILVFCAYHVFLLFVSNFVFLWFLVIDEVFLCCVGGSCADVGSPTCTHLVVEERTVKNFPADIQGRPMAVRSEVLQLIILACFTSFAFSFIWVVVWLSGNSIGHISKITLLRACLVLGWVTIRGLTILVCNQPLMPVQSPTVSETGNEYQ